MNKNLVVGRWWNHINDNDDDDCIEMNEWMNGMAIWYLGEVNVNVNVVDDG